MGICEEPEGSTGKFGYRTLELCLVLSLIKNKKSTQNLLVILDMSSCYSKHRHCRLSVRVPEKLFQRSLWMELHGHCQTALHLHNRMLCWPVVGGLTQRQMPDALKSNISWIQLLTWTIHRSSLAPVASANGFGFLEGQDLLWWLKLVAFRCRKGGTWASVEKLEPFPRRPHNAAFCPHVLPAVEDILHNVHDRYINI